MARKKKIEEKNDISATEPQTPTRSDEEFFKGGMPIDLNKRIKGGLLLKDKLAGDIADMLRQEIKNHRPRIQKISKWEKIYRGEKKKKSYPYPGCSNLSVPITRIRVDTTAVRIFDVLRGQQKLFIVKPLKPEIADLIPSIEDAIEWWQKHQVKLLDKLYSPIMQAIKTGTGFVYMPYVTRKRTVYRLLGEWEPVNGKEIKINTLAGIRRGIKEAITEFSGTDVIPVDRKDVIWSSDVTDINQAQISGFKTYFRKQQIETFVKQGFYFQDIMNKIFPTEYDETQKRRAQEKGVELSTEDKEPYEIWRLWTKYDIDEDGEEDDIIISMHEPSGTILRATYNEFFSGFRPLIPIVFYPLEYSVDGEGMCEMMEQLQVLIDTIVNQRLDRMDIISNPITLVRAGAGIDNFERVPGSTWFVHDIPEQVVMELRSGDVYPSTWQEEQLINHYADQLSGVTPAVMGQQTSERPVARETFALLQEANKKFKFGIDNIRDKINKIGETAIEEMAQFSPHYTYFVDEEGFQVKKELILPYSLMRDAVKIEVAASSEMFNQEARREIDLTIYQLLNDFYTKMAGMMQAVSSPQIPSSFKIFILKVIEAGIENLRNILNDFNRKDAEKLLVTLNEIPGLDMLIQNSPDIMAQMQRAMGQGMSTQQALPSEGEMPPEVPSGETQ